MGKFERNHLNKKSERGVTLIELTFVMLIFGLIIAMFAPVYNLYLKNQAELTTRQNTDLIVSEITEFLNVYGRYPCPAPPAVSRDEPEYGREADECSIPVGDPVTIATGDCDTTTNNPNSGICVETGQNANVISQRIIVGAVPFRELNIDEDFSYDGYQNKITYAVTEILTKEGQYEPGRGGIRILEGDDATDTNNMDIDENFGIHFIVYSHGENGFGAYNNNGTQLSCAAATGFEQDNCFDVAGNGQFRIAQRSTNFGSNTEYDDVAAFITRDDVPHFALDPATNTIVSRKPSMGQLLPNGVESTPERELDVGGNIRAQQNLKSNQLCTYGNDGECFSAQLIAGDDPNMECPTGYVRRIENSAVVCQEEVVSSCGVGEVMTGINTDGTIICESFNAPECASVDVDICPGNPGTYTLPVGQDNDRVRAEEINLPLVARYQRYRCRNGSWQPHGGAWGTCGCIEGEVLARDTRACGTCQTGTYDNVRIRRCPSGSQTIRENDTCSCDDTTPCYATRNVSCDPGLTLVGNPIVEQRLFRCDPGGVPVGFTGSWTPTATSGTCQCIPSPPQEGSMGCSELDSTLTEQVAGVLIPTRRDFNCGTNSYDAREFDDTRAPGFLSGANLTDDSVKNHYCVCNTSLPPQTRDVSCASRYPGWTGVIDEKRDYDCGSQSWSSYYPDHPSLDETSTSIEIRDTFCTEIPPVVCRWQKGSSMGGTSTVFLGSEVGSTCDCDMDSADKIDNCHDVLPGGTNAKNYSGCICG